MAAKVFRLVIARILPVVGLTIFALLSCNKKHVTNPINNPKPGSIIVHPQKRNIVADGRDTSSIFITVLDSTGALMVDSTDIYIHNTGIGILSSNHISIYDGSGQARIKITAPVNIIHGPSLDTVFFEGSNSEPILAPDTLIIQYVPGIISQMEFIYPESTVTLVAGSGETCSVVLHVTDANGNPIDIGTHMVFHHGPVITSMLIPDTLSAPIIGIARNIYTVGSGTGDDYVWVSVLNPQNANDTIRTNPPVIFRCIGDRPDKVLVLSASDSIIVVGGDSNQIIATLQDAYGNPLSEGYYVAFGITASPGNPDSADQKPSFDIQSLVERDTVMTNINGQAIVRLYSGTRSGSVSILACTIPLPPDSLNVCDEKSLVTVFAGPPHHMQVSSALSGGRIPGYPERYCTVAALVYDRYSNFVEHGTAVYFNLIPEDIGEIEGYSYTGGGKPYLADSIEGVAYSRIIYSCISTFDFIQVAAHSLGDSAEVADTSEILGLPIYQGNLAITANPESLWTENDSCDCGQFGQNCRDTSDIMVTLTDGGGCPINGGIIQFSAQIAGFILGNSLDTTDADGQASAKYMIRGCDIPCHDNECSIETIVRAVLVQKPSVVGTASIFCSRPPH